MIGRSRGADAALDQLLAIMARLRDPERGCPWDREQTYATIAPYTIEEAYEVAEAIRLEDYGALREELGDLLFQVVFHAQMASEHGRFDLAAVVEDLCAKMIGRHPHVFGGATIDTPAAQTRAWEAHKAVERTAKARGARQSVLDGVPLALPALTRSQKLQSRAGRVGFDWPSAAEVLAKIDEEVAELKREIAAGADKGRLSDEIGDVLCTVVNLARHLGIDAEAAAQGTNAKFARRFRYVEEVLAAQGRTPEQATLAEMDALWDEAKAAEPRTATSFLAKR
ncbi:MAG: nucleoside triphosphate pyrophosphohydrolase [Alphaproteobacteria bacterium]|nr:nucleoside triphosphate pyrophosphohydrolase [Alphaproteobacteria bacterium]